MNVKHYIVFTLCGFFVTIPSALAAPKLDHVLYKGEYEAVGWEIKYALTPSFGYRFSGYERVGLHSKQKEFTHSVTRLNNRSVSTLLDWHPGRKSFRATIGIFASSHRVEYFVEPTVDLRFDGAVIRVDKSRIADEITFNDKVIDLSQYGFGNNITIKGKTFRRFKDSIPAMIVIDPQVFQLQRNDIHITANADFKPLASYFGIGWGNRPLSDQRIRYSLDMGIIYLGRPEVSLTVNGDILDIHPRLTEELNEYVAEEQRKLQRKAEDLRLMPYISLGVSLGF
jgi:hypothetical protein